MKRTSRRGLTLLEVILASAIFIASMAVIGQMLDNGLFLVGINERATIALLRCESKMEEIVAGIQPIDERLPKTPMVYEDDPRWRWSVVMSSTPVDGLLRATVVVDYYEDPTSTEEESNYRETLTRLISDPSLLQVSPEVGAIPEGTITIPEMLGLGPTQSGRPGK